MSIFLWFSWGSNSQSRSGLAFHLFTLSPSFMTLLAFGCIISKSGNQTKTSCALVILRGEKNARTQTPPQSLSLPRPCGPWPSTRNLHPPYPRRRGRMARQSQAPPRAGLGIGDSQGCAWAIPFWKEIPYKTITEYNNNRCLRSWINFCCVNAASNSRLPRKRILFDIVRLVAVIADLRMRKLLRKHLILTRQLYEARLIKTTARTSRRVS